MAYNSTVLPMRQDFKKGDLIFHQGDKGNCAYIVEKGSVEVFLINERGMEFSVSQLGIGEIFGEMAIIDSHPRSASVRAHEDCRLSLVSEKQLNSRVSKADPVVKLLMHVLLKRIRIETQKNSNQIKKPLKEYIQPMGQQNIENQLAIERIQFEREIENALTNNELSIHYQPIFEMNSGQLAGFEALTRWNNPSKGWVSPNVFMEIAEEGSLIIPIGRWVLKKSIEDLNEINKSLNTRPFMAINVSGRQLDDPLFLKELQSCISQSECDMKQIKLEITERVLVQKKTAIAWINSCQQMGLSIALDDFGTGYSSLSALTQLNIDTLKIDKSFIEKIGSCKNNEVVLRGIIDMANHLNISVVAEGIETHKQKKLLTDIGCNYGQGYIYSKPLPIHTLLEFSSKLNNTNDTRVS